MLVGPRGVGKSHVLLQCVAHALESGWIVLYIPRGIGMINSTSPFAYVASQQTYAQRALSQSVAANLASQVALGDVAVLDLPLETDLPRSSARELAAHLANHAAALSPSALAGGLHLLLLSLAAQTKTPMLLAIDDAQALYMRSAYKDADSRPLEAWQLSLPRSLLSLLDSHKIQRGATLAALGLSTSEYRPPAALLRALGREELHGCNTGYTPLNAYSAVDATHEQHARAAGWKCVEVGNLQAREAKGMWDVKRMEGATWNGEFFSFFAAVCVGHGQKYGTLI
jgi:small subunit ribosomal protein S29